ncbi:MAG: protein BatD [Chitinophagia bacterium]|nr:protein BatD [Chitinophagia bacterium]
MWRSNILFLIVVSGCWQAWAQTSFVAVPSATRIGIKDPVQVTFTINNVDNLKDVVPPAFGDFQVLQGPFTSRSVNFINGARSSSFSIIYVVQARHEGRLLIPPATARDGEGHLLHSNPVNIEVVPGSLAQQQRPVMPDDEDDPFAEMQRQMQRMQQMQRQMFQQQQQMARGQQPVPNPQPQRDDEPVVSDAEINKNLFIRVTVDKNKARVGEQITTSYKLYSRVPMQVSISKLPSLNGFWTQDFEIPRQPKPTEEVVEGKRYQVFLLKKSALFPQQAGTLELDPAEAKGVARIVQQVKRRMSDMFDPFGAGTLMMNDPFFNNQVFNTMAYKDVDVHLKSSPVKITVDALPEKERPADYGGAVGQFTLSSKIDKTELTTDDVAALTLTISGSGNLKLIQAPMLTLPNGMNTYDPQIIDTITGRSTTISGSKIISYALTPQTPGDYEIPAMSFTYFNPQTGKYTTLHTTPYKLHVKPGKNNGVARRDAAHTVNLTDIHDISKKPANSAPSVDKPLLYTPVYWSLYALPMLAFVGLLFYRRRNEEMLRDTTMLRNKRANKVALQRLATAKRYLLENSKKPFYEEISKAIWLYLSDKSGIPLASLNKEAAQVALSGKRVPENLRTNFESLVDECETALYASGGAKPMSQTFDEAVKVLSDMEGFM